MRLVQKRPPRTNLFAWYRAAVNGSSLVGADDDPSVVALQVGRKAAKREHTSTTVISFRDLEMAKEKVNDVER